MLWQGKRYVEGHHTVYVVMDAGECCSRKVNDRGKLHVTSRHKGDMFLSWTRQYYHWTCQYYH